MPLGKYYCDYCDKEFQDTRLARTRHLQSSLHLRSKSLWYDSLRLQESSNNHHTFGEGYGRGICNRFVNTGFCPYGDSCKYAHPKTPTVSNTQFPADNQQVATITGNQPVGATSFQGGMVVKDRKGVTWGNLPPSLQPPPEGGYSDLLPFVDWG